MKKLFITLLFATSVAAGLSQPTYAAAREEAKLIEASGVLEELQSQRDTYIPDRLLSRAYGIAVIPNVIKVAAVVGGRRGTGALVVRDSSGKFSDPVMVSITGGNVGWQIGVQATDIVLVFTTRKSVEDIADGKLTLGGDASVAAGPVGRAASAATDQNFTAEVYSYSRNRGLFAGVSLDGSVIAIDSKSNRKLYGKTAPASDIIAGNVHTDSAEANRFKRAILASTSGAAPAAAHVSSGNAISTPAETAPGAEPPR
jgi:lipid-binding SYLF domain-containing protein